MNMNIIFTFPFNNWDKLFIEDEKLNITPTCLCSQEISKDIMERYNWDDKDIEKLIELLGEVYLLDMDYIKLVENKSLIKQGLCFYDSNCIDKVQDLINKLNIKILKQKKLNKKLDIENPIEEIIIEKSIKNSQINSMIKEGYSFIYIHRYINKGGLTIILFTNNVDKFIHKLNAIKLKSYIELNDW